MEVSDLRHDHDGNDVGNGSKQATSLRHAGKMLKFDAVPTNPQ